MMMPFCASSGGSAQMSSMVVVSITLTWTLTGDAVGTERKGEKNVVWCTYAHNVIPFPGRSLYNVQTLCPCVYYRTTWSDLVQFGRKWHSLNARSTLSPGGPLHSCFTDPWMSMVTNSALTTPSNCGLITHWLGRHPVATWCKCVRDADIILQRVCG